MKKVLTILTIAFVVLLALVGALAVVPHAHESDLDHSSHASCPIYQFSLHTIHASVFLFVWLFIGLSAGIIFRTQAFVLPKSFSLFTASLRAPPVTS